MDDASAVANILRLRVASNGADQSVLDENRSVPALGCIIVAKGKYLRATSRLASSYIH